MKYGFTSFSCPELSLDALLQVAHKFGYDAIEPRADRNHGHGIELEADAMARRQIRDKVAASGIALCCLGVSCRYTDPQTVASQVAATHQYIDLAADVGAPLLRVFGGVIPAGMTRAEATQQVVQSLLAVADHAAERNVCVVVETHDDWSAPQHITEVLRQVNHPAVALVWDIMHPVRTGGVTMDEAYTQLKPWIRHVHVHDGSLRTDKLEFRPIGAGEIDHRRAIQLLLADGYTGYLSGEWINWEPCEVHLPRELATLKRLVAECRAG